MESPIPPIGKILKNAGVDRIRDDAKEALVEAIKEFRNDIAIKTTGFRRHTSRKTLKREDIKLATKTCSQLQNKRDLMVSLFGVAIYYSY